MLTPVRHRGPVSVLRDPTRGRPLVRLSPPLDTEYALAVERIADRVESALGPQVFADRPREPRPWPLAWRAFVDRAGELSEGCHLLRADVRTCFPSIGSETVSRAMVRVGCHPSEVSRVRAVLTVVSGYDVVGLPVGPSASATLASLVLSEVDEALQRSGILHLRWVDDFFVFVSGPSEVRRALRVLGSSLGRAGLRLAPEKTRIMRGPCDLPRSSRSAQGPDRIQLV